VLNPLRVALNSGRGIPDHLEKAIDELRAALAKVHLVNGSNNAASDTLRGETLSEEYLSVKQVAKRIPYREQTIRNLMSAGEFKEGVHYYKRRRRVMFRWSEVEQWLRHRTERNEAEEPFYPVHDARTRKTS
jgi:predicted DNA-binding transcriptional regulator AlpA